MLGVIGLLPIGQREKFLNFFESMFNVTLFAGFEAMYKWSLEIFLTKTMIEFNSDTLLLENEPLYLYGAREKQAMVIEY